MRLIQYFCVHVSLGVAGVGMWKSSYVAVCFCVADFLSVCVLASGLSSCVCACLKCLNTLSVTYYLSILNMINVFVTYNAEVNSLMPRSHRNYVHAVPMSSTKRKPPLADFFGRPDFLVARKKLSSEDFDAHAWQSS